MYSAKVAKIALSVILLLFCTFVPDLAAAQVQHLKADQRNEFRIIFFADMARPGRYRLDISENTISSAAAFCWRANDTYMVGLDRGDDSEGGIEADSTHSTYDYKSPTAAFMIGFVPGFFIHGLGHAYIGKGNTALLLFGIEIVSFVFFVVAFGLGMRHLDGGSGGDIPDPGPWTLASTALFFSSWMYDFGAAPAKAKKMNEQADRERKNKAIMSIGAGIKDNQARLVVSLRW